MLHNKTGTRFYLSDLGLAVISSAVLHLELVQMRIFSLALWHHLAYMVITIALLGFGAAGTLIALFPQKFIKNPSRTAAISSSIFAVSIWIAFWVTSKARLDTFQLFTPEGIQYDQLLMLFGYYAAFLIPFIFAGIAVSVTFAGHPDRSYRLYFFNMSGSALGIGIFIFSFGELGGERSIATGCMIALLGGLLFAISRSDFRLCGITALLMVLIGVGGWFFSAVLEPLPASSKAYGMYQDTLHDFKRVYSKWNTISRIDVISSNENLLPWLPGDTSYAPHMAITIDGDATTWMWNFGGRPEDICGIRNDLYSAAYLTKRSPEVLVIGLGGGNDIRAALHFKSRRVVGVELNALIAELPGKIFPDFVDNIYSDPGVEIHVGEGRSFLRRSRERFDIIQMSGVDTWSGLSSGSYVLSENYLYTVDAFQDYLAKLNPDGVLAVNRWLFDPPREMLRMTSVGAEAFRQLGIQDPWNHIIVLAEQHFCSTLFKKSPWTPKEIATYVWYDKTHDKFELKYSPGTQSDNPFVGLMDAIRTGKEKQFYREYIYNITPVTDDAPFFFDYYKWQHLPGQLFSSGTGGQIGANWPIAFTILTALLIQTILMVALLIFYPLNRFHQQGLAYREAYYLVGYFFCLGCGYMFFEIVMMQKLILYLGHPTLSIAVVMGGMLFFSGLGSLSVSPFAGIKPLRIQVFMVMIVACMLGIGIFLPHIISATLDRNLTSRVLIALAVISIPAFIMGTPFPAGLKLAGKKMTAAVPWAWGTNGGASVLASILAIIVAMNAGFFIVFCLSAALYLTAALIFYALNRRPNEIY